MDLDGDGKMDLISGSYSPGEVWWFKGVEGGFAEGKAIAETTDGSVRRSATAASAVDWDGDGDLDLLVGNIDGDVSWIENTGTKTEPKFGARVALEADGKKIRAPGGHAHPVGVDWDGDGVLDLLVGCGDGQVLFYKGKKVEGKKTPVLAAPVALTAGGKPIELGHSAKLAVCDWNEDGELDLLVGTDDTVSDKQYRGNVYVLLRKTKK